MRMYQFNKKVSESLSFLHSWQTIILDWLSIFVKKKRKNDMPVGV